LPGELVDVLAFLLGDVRHGNIGDTSSQAQHGELSVNWHPVPPVAVEIEKTLSVSRLRQHCIPPITHAVNPATCHGEFWWLNIAIVRS